MLTANLVQSAFRFRNDDGSETTATWMEALNTACTCPLDQTFRLRTAISETAGGSLNNTTHALEYSINGGAWTLVTNLTPVHFVTSANVADGTPTTQQITSGTYSGDPSEVDSNNTVQNAPSWAGNDHVEYEAVLTLDSAQLNGGETIQLRNQGLNGYTFTASLTTQAAAATHNGALDAAMAAFQADLTGTRTQQTFNGTMDAAMAAFQADLTGTRVQPTYNGTLDASLAAFQMDLTGTAQLPTVTRAGTLDAAMAAFGMELLGDIDQRGVYINTTQTLTGAVRQDWTAWSDTQVTWDATRGSLPTATALEHAIVTRDGQVVWSPVTVQFQGLIIVFSGVGA